jgi:hypothetical protein
MSVNTAIKVGAGTGISAARVGMGAMFPGSDFIHGVVSSMMDVVKNVGQDAANKAIDSKAVGGRVLESMETHVVKIQEMGASLVNNPAIQQAIATMPNNIEVSSDQITNESATNQIKVPAAVQKIIDEHDNGEVQQTHIEALNAEKSGPSKGNLSPAH